MKEKFKEIISPIITNYYFILSQILKHKIDLNIFLISFYLQY